MKKCPYCAEEILDDAVKCKHCHEFLIPINPLLSFGECDTCNAPLTDSSGFCSACGVMQSTPQSEHSGESGNNLKCPECASAHITAQKIGFGLGKAAVGGLILGPLGLLGGVVGAGKIKMTCLSCGHSWNPGNSVKKYARCNSCNANNRVEDCTCIRCGAPLF